MGLGHESQGKQWLDGYLERDNWYKISLETMSCFEVIAHE